MTSQYDYNFKIELSKKIYKIKSKKILYEIFLIISQYTKNYTQNDNGTFVFFHNLPDIVYFKINKYVNRIYCSYQKKIETSILDSDKLTATHRFVSDMNNSIMM